MTAFKIQLNMPIYGRIFNKTAGLDTSFDVNSSKAISSWDSGVWDYKVLFKTDAVVYYDDKIGATYSYVKGTGQLISYDTVDAIKQKAEYIKDNHLGGGFFWEASADKKGEESLIKTLTKQLGKLDQSLNMLNYSLSKYSNIKANMSSWSLASKRFIHLVQWFFEICSRRHEYSREHGLRYWQGMNAEVCIASYDIR